MQQIFSLILLLSTITGAGSTQINVSGTVRSSNDNEPIAGATVIFRNEAGKIGKYSSTGTDGSFSIAVESSKGCRLEVSAMSHARRNIVLDSVTCPLNIYLDPANFELKEVSIKAERIREQGDTVTYDVGAFAQTQDRSIGDVLKRMPGIDVQKSGKIQYQGTDINKFYIEGSDLLGGKYGIATSGINHEDVGAVEVMENHQPMQVLSGINFSDKAAINLKLKNKAKATWSLHGDAGAGFSWQPEGAVWNGELFAMAVMPSFQNITTFKADNTGEDLTLHTTDFFSTGRGTGLTRHVDIAMPGVPSLNQKRTLLNRSALISTNNLWKLHNGEFKAQIDYAYNHVSTNATAITTYFLNDGNRVVTEDRYGGDRSHSLSGNFIYEVNQKNTFINNTLQTGINWDNLRLSMTGSLPNDQSASLPDYYVANKFKMIKRFHGKHLIKLESNNEWESLPQTLNVLSSNLNLRQHIGDHAFCTDERAAYAFTLKGITLSLEGGLKGYLRSLNTDLSGLPDIASGFHNSINTNSLNVYVTPKFEYWIKRVDITLNAPICFEHYTFNYAIANRSELYVSPSLSLNWKPNNRFSITLRGGGRRAPMNFNLIHPEPIMTDYRSLNSGIADFHTSTSQNISANLSYKHTRHGLFANAMAMHSWSHLPYTMIQQLYGDYIIYGYSAARSSSRRLMTMANIGKTLDFIHGSANINGTFSRNNSRLISEGVHVASTGTSWMIGTKINGSPLQWLSVDYALTFASSRLTMNGISASWLSRMENELLINVMPHQKWEWYISGEHYRNEVSANRFKNVVLLDTKLVYKLNRRIELSANLTNIFNHRTYNYTTYNQLSSFESQRQLRGRMLLLSVYLKK